MSEKLTRREEQDLDRRQRDLKRRLSSSDYPDTILLDIPADPADREARRRPLLQSEKCLHGEHEADAGSPACADGLNLTWRAPDGLKRIVCVCKYCRCLFVEKA